MHRGEPRITRGILHPFFPNWEFFHTILLYEGVDSPRASHYRLSSVAAALRHHASLSSIVASSIPTTLLQCFCSLDGSYETCRAALCLVHSTWAACTNQNTSCPSVSRLREIHRRRYVRCKGRPERQCFQPSVDSENHFGDAGQRSRYLKNRGCEESKSISTQLRRGPLLAKASTSSQVEYVPSAQKH